MCDEQTYILDLAFIFTILKLHYHNPDYNSVNL